MNSEPEVINCVKALRDGCMIVYPGETGWSLGCDFKNSDAVNAILKSPDVEYPCILLGETGQLGKYHREIPDVIWDLVEFTTKPLHLVLDNVINVPENIIENNQSVFRIARDEFTASLVRKFGKPVFTAVLKNQHQPVREKSVLNIPSYVVNLRAGSKLTTEKLVIIRLSDGGKIEFLKK